MYKLLALYIIFFLFSSLVSCKTVKEIKTPEEKTKPKESCLQYKIPDNMEESPEDALHFKYDNLIVEKGKKFDKSNILIAIRVRDNTAKYSLKEFVNIDQGHLKNQVRLIDQEEWSPPGFDEKSIKYFSFQFSYISQGNTIFQRSVYMQCNDKIFIVSLSSKNKNSINEKKNDSFWESINLSP